MINENVLIKNINNPNLLLNNLIELSESIINSHNFEYENEDKLIQNAASFLLEKASRFDPEKSKATNFFLTCLSCYLIQIRRSQKERIKTKAILDENNWEIISHSPFKIRAIHDKKSTATGQAARIIVQTFRRQKMLNSINLNKRKSKKNVGKN